MFLDCKRDVVRSENQVGKNKCVAFVRAEEEGQLLDGVVLDVEDVLVGPVLKGNGIDFKIQLLLV